MLCDNWVTKEMAMKIILQIVGGLVLFFLAFLLTTCANESKRDNCVDMGGKFVLNMTHANRSMCILEN
jgi:hypothetical protein